MVDTQSFIFKLIGLILLIVIIILIILIVKKYKHKHEITPTSFPTNSIIEKFAGSDCSTMNPNLINLGSNPLIKRDGSNVIISPSGSLSDSSNITIDSQNVGWLPNMNGGNASLIVDLKKLTKISYIVTSGIKAFKAFYSRSDNDAYAYEEILYQNTNSEKTSDNRSTLFFEACAYDEVTKFGGLTTSEGQPIFASYIKIVPLNLSEVTSLCSTAPSGNTFSENGMKIEIFGTSPEAVINIGGESLMGSTKLYNENGVLLNSTLWVGELNNQDSKLKIVFSDNDQVTPKTIHSIIFSSGDQGDVVDKQWVTEFSITYNYPESKISDTIYNIKGNTNCGETNIFQYYFEKPIIATELLIKPSSKKYPTKQPRFKIIDIIGSTLTTSQQKTMVNKTKKEFCSPPEEDNTSGSVSNLLSSQTEIQQLCDALDLQDQIKENNQKIQKNRQYLMQLEEQDKKIANLEDIVNKMKHIREVRKQNNDHKMTDQQISQAKIEAQLEELIKDRKKRQRQLNVKLNLGPASLSNLEKQVSAVENKAGIGNSTSTTPLQEGFVNYRHDINSTLNFSDACVSEPQNQGFYYRPFEDETIKNQTNDIYNPDYRYVNLQSVGDKYEKVQSTFFEDRVLQCKSCDTNVKMLKKL
jgi:hypothetical protein